MRRRRREGGGGGGGGGVSSAGYDPNQVAPVGCPSVPVSSPPPRNQIYWSWDCQPSLHISSVLETMKAEMKGTWFIGRK